MKIKVLNIITKLELGGAQKVSLYSANNLGDEFEPYFISGELGILDDKKTQNYTNIKQFFNIPEMKRKICPVNDFIAFLKLIKLIKKIKPQIIHTHCPKAGVLGRWAAFFTKTPTIIHTHHGFAFTNNLNTNTNFYTIIERINSFITDKLIFVSKANFDFALKNKITSSKKAEIIHGGIKINEYKQHKIKVQNIKKDTIIGTISCFKNVKAPLDIIKIANEFKHTNFKFTIIGDGDLRPTLEAEIKKLDLQNIELLGWRHDIKNLLQTFDIFILTSLSEGLPMAIMEAMASGVPIIATNIGGIKDLITTNHNGILLEPHNISGFAENIKNLANDNDKQKMFIENSYKILTEDFNENKTIEKIKTLYKKENLSCKN